MPAVLARSAATPPLPPHRPPLSEEEEIEGLAPPMVLPSKGPRPSRQGKAGPVQAPTEAEDEPEVGVSACGCA